MSKFTPPPVLWPEIVDQYFVRDQNGDEIADPVLLGIRDALRRMKEASVNMAAARDAILGNEAELPARRALQNAQKQQQLMQPLSAMIDKAQEQAGRVIGNLESEMAVPCPDTRDPLRRVEESEIRTALRSLSEQDRNAAIAGDETFQIAVLNSNPVLSGIQPTRHKMMLAEWRNKHHPEKVEHVKRLTGASEALKVAAARMRSLSREFSKSDLLESAGRSERAAKAVLEAQPDRSGLLPTIE